MKMKVSGVEETIQHDSKIAAASSDIVQLVSFSLGGEEFGVDILKVQEINRIMRLTKVPNSPDFVDGIVNLRGKVIPVLNLRNRLYDSFYISISEGIDPFTTNFTYFAEKCERDIGFIVDAVSEVLRIPKNTIEPAPAIVSGVEADYIEGVGKLNDRLLIILNMDKILSANEIEQIKKAA